MAQIPHFLNLLTIFFSAFFYKKLKEILVLSPFLILCYISIWYDLIT